MLSPYVKVRVYIAANFRTGLDNLLQLDFNEVVVRLYVLLDETLDFEERRQKIPLVSFRVYRVRQGFRIIERLEESFEILESSQRYKGQPPCP